MKDSIIDKAEVGINGQEANACVDIMKWPMLIYLACMKAAERRLLVSVEHYHYG